MSESNEQQQPQTINYWDANIRTVAGLLSEVSDEYVSKERLRRIAVLALMQLMAMFETAKAEEEKANKEPESKLLLPEKGLILP